MKDLIYFKPSALDNPAAAALPGAELLKYYFRLYGAGAVPADRTSTIRTPFNMRIIQRIPALRAQPKSLGTICDERAREIINRAEKLDVRIYCLWSGGIDSTLVLSSLLKNATLDQRKRISILMSSESIDENRTFFYDHIHTKLDVAMSTVLPSVLGSEHILVSGEANDQLFGSDMLGKFINTFGESVIREPFDRDHVTTIFSGILGAEAPANALIGLFERLLPAAPIPLSTTYDFLWWVNFALKWQTVSYRLLTYTAPHNKDNITEEYVQERYFPFFTTDDFQLWSLNNHDKKIKNDWKSYKWPCKDLIYEFTKDAEYRDHKTKRGSLGPFMRYRHSFKMVARDFTIHPSIDLAEYSDPQTDFILPL